MTNLRLALAEICLGWAMAIIPKNTAEAQRLAWALRQYLNLEKAEIISKAALEGKE